MDTINVLCTVKGPARDFSQCQLSINLILLPSLSTSRKVTTAADNDNDNHKYSGKGDEMDVLNDRGGGQQKQLLLIINIKMIITNHELENLKMISKCDR